MPTSVDAWAAILSIGAIYVVAGVAGFVTLLAPHSDKANDLALFVISISAFVIGIGLVARRHHASTLAVYCAYVGGVLLISSSITLDNSTASANVAMYVWLAVLVGFFLTPRRAFVIWAVLGACYAGVLATRHSLDPVDHWVQLMSVLGSIIGFIAIVRKSILRTMDDLASAARTDPLTNLLNRRGVLDELAWACEEAPVVATLVADLDFFKQVNDQYGHDRGDEMLVRFAQTLLTHAPEGTVIGRTGGEEFVLILRVEDPTAAITIIAEVQELAERIVRETARSLEIDGAPVTTSVGCSVVATASTEAAEALRQADTALYAAKQLGRNRFVVFDEEVRHFVEGIEERASRQRDIQVATLVTLCEALDERDPYTNRHSRAVAAIAEELGQRLGLPARQVERIRVAGLVHDIGKIGIPDEILHKPSKLDDEEFARMRAHPEIGARLLNSVDLLDVREWVLSHHERIDGMGYPRKLSGDAIPTGARILAVADAFEAMIADRVYRKGMGVERALAELERCTGTQFDGRIVELMPEIVAARPDIIDMVTRRSDRAQQPAEHVVDLRPTIQLDLAGSLSDSDLDEAPEDGTVPQAA